MPAKNGNGKNLTAAAIVGILSIIVLVVLTFNSTAIMGHQERLDDMPDKFVLKERYKCDQDRFERKLDYLIQRLDGIYGQRHRGLQPDGG